VLATPAPAATGRLGSGSGGGVMGVSSITTYMESGAGVTEGARKGLASHVTADCSFCLTIFFVPLIAVIARPLSN
jgi:AGZA family xanthine/uracil permease-like MFS transporter